MDIPRQEKKMGVQPKAGVQVARLIEIIDIGTQAPFDPSFNATRKVRLLFELPKDTHEFDGKKKPLVLSKEYTFSTSNKGKLREMILAWQNIDIASSEPFEIEDLLGKTAMVSIRHNDKGYAQLTSVIAVPDGMDVDSAFNDMKTLFLTEELFDLETYKSLPDFVRDKIKLSPEFKALKVEG